MKQPNSHPWKSGKRMSKEEKEFISNSRKEKKELKNQAISRNHFRIERENKYAGLRAED